MKDKNFLTFSDALNTRRPAAFSAMVKPIGPSCNLDCHYCYYLDKSEIYEKHTPKMSDELLEEFIAQYIEGNDVPEVNFCWHGGEPLLAGLDFYVKAMEFQDKYKGNKKIINTLQTNGVLLDQQWCEFFAKHEFLIGLSIDGPKDIHDANRVNKGGEPTFDRVMKGVEMMKQYGVEFNTLSVVSKYCEGRGAEIYEFMKSIGSHYMQFLPAVEHVVDTPGGRPAIVPPYKVANSYLAPWSVSAKGYGQFLNSIFDRWILSDVGTYYVQMFDVALASWVGVQPALCAFSETCGGAMIVEHNGDIYPCDHFVYKDHLMGNILKDDLVDVYRSTAQFKFGLSKRNTLPNSCLKCKFYFACRGECPKHRFETSPRGEKGINTLCEGFKIFYSHVDPYMKYMADMLSKQMPPAMVMGWARSRMGL